MGPVDVSHSADLETEVQVCPNALLKLEIPFCPFPQHMSAQVFLCQVPVWSHSFGPVPVIFVLCFMKVLLSSPNHTASS